VCVEEGMRDILSGPYWCTFVVAAECIALSRTNAVNFFKYLRSSWLQIRRPGFDSRHYQKKVVGLKRGPLSLVSTTEELLYRKVAAPV
jgi:hypothetical protein